MERNNKSISKGWNTLKVTVRFKAILQLATYLVCFYNEQL